MAAVAELRSLGSIKHMQSIFILFVLVATPSIGLSAVFTAKKKSSRVIGAVLFGLGVGMVVGIIDAIGRFGATRLAAFFIPALMSFIVVTPFLLRRKAEPKHENANL